MMKSVLLAVCGLAPQVITETLYALHREGRSVDAIRVITTAKGKRCCIAQLFGAGDGHYLRYLEDYGFSPDEIDFGPQHVRAVTAPDGREIDDLARVEESEWFLAACLEEAFNWCNRDDWRVFFSIAGGRKTMGASLMIAAQFYARPWDRVYHVLVSPEFESSAEFFYPPPTSRKVQLFDEKGQPYLKETRYAQVTLVPMPFISVRDRLSPELLKRPESPGALMSSLVRDNPPVLVVDCQGRKIAWRGRELDMTPAHLALYAFFALQKRSANCGRDRCGNCTDCYLDWEAINARAGEIARIYQTLRPYYPGREGSESGITAISKENFNSYKSKIRGILERAYGPYELHLLEISSEGSRPDTRYGIRLDRGPIEVRL